MEKEKKTKVGVLSFAKEGNVWFDLRRTPQWS